MPIEAKLKFTPALDAAIHRCVMTGTHPTELWLGPDMRKYLLALNEAWTGYPLKSIQLVDGKSQYNGLTIRFMEQDGLRVGKTFPHEEEND